MTAVDLRFHDYKYFPYERVLAHREVARLLMGEPEPTDRGFRVFTPNGVPVDALRALTYFREASIAGGDPVLTTQARLESSARSRKAQVSTRQSTRYSAHGLHEYRGKFNPQIAHAAFNLVGLGSRGRVWDPFCGSGTVLLEAAHHGHDAMGTDLNPLAVLIANAKIKAVRCEGPVLAALSDSIVRGLDGFAAAAGDPDVATAEARRRFGTDWRRALPNADYLSQWFPEAVLAQFRLIFDLIDQVVPEPMRVVFLVILSDIVRDVSWQDPSDLRIRRRKDPADNYPAITAFGNAVTRKTQSIVAAKAVLPRVAGSQLAVLADCCLSGGPGGEADRYLRGGVDAVISSPPYANALPYIDTQRLSLALLGLGDHRGIKDLDGALVGSREVSLRERKELLTALRTNEANLPRGVHELCLRLSDSADPTSDGFRRMNTPALVYRYFAGMQESLRNAFNALRPGGSLVFIVGPNRTKLGGVDLVIETPELLALLGESVGLGFRELLELEAYSRFDVHSKNSIREEKLLWMRRPTA